MQQQEFENLFYCMALSQVNGIGNIQAQLLLEQCGSAKAVFESKKIHKIEGIGEVRAKAIRDFNQFSLVEKEIEFCKKNNIQILTLSQQSYPQKLKHCYDAPICLFFKGNGNLNADKSITIIGTRSPTTYGKNSTELIIKDLVDFKPQIVSGLALGIDTFAHTKALEHGVETIAVLAHGLHTIYPAENKKLADNIIENGGLLTEYWSGTKPDKHNFPKRNRIVAGISHCTIVVETQLKGGSMITAELAFQYNRDVFVVPGRITDTKSSGCLNLLAQQKAIPYTTADLFLDTMGWKQHKKNNKIQQSLFLNLSMDEQKVLDIISKKDIVHIDELLQLSAFTPSFLASVILQLEMYNAIKGLPGKCYSLA